MKKVRPMNSRRRSALCSKTRMLQIRLRYQDGSSMAEHMNAFQGLIHQATSLEVPLADEVLALFLLGSLPKTWETLVVTLGTIGRMGRDYP